MKMSATRQSFADLMALETVKSLDSSKWAQYRSLAAAYSPGSTGSAYGGHPFAQAAWAAAQTVESGFVLHNVTGHFLLQCDATAAFEYKVRILRNGKGYCTRAVDVVQNGREDVSFSCVCSFKRPEQNRTSVRLLRKANLRQRYGGFLSEAKPENWPEAPTVDSPWYWRYLSTQNDVTDDFPGVSIRKVDMDEYNALRSPFDRRQLHYYSIRGEMPPFQTDPNLHVCAHLYASDRNGLFIIPNHSDAGDHYKQLATLSHTVVLQSTAASELSMIDQQGGPRWFCQELRLDGVDDGRGLVASQMWTDTEVVMASTVQDGLLRFSDDGIKLLEGKNSNGVEQKSKL